MAIDMVQPKTPREWLAEWTLHIAGLKGQDQLRIQVECEAAAESLLADVAGGKLAARRTAGDLAKAADLAGLPDAAGIVFPLFGLAAPVAVKSQRKKRNAAVEKMREAAEDDRPLIQIAAGQLARIAAEAEEHLIAAGAAFYQRGNHLVRPVLIETPAARGRTMQVPRLAMVDDIYMRLALAEHIRWEKFDKRCDDWVAADPTKDIAATLNARYGDWKFPPVTGVIGTQTMRWDGSLVLRPGYDPQTGLILVNPPELPDMPDKPTRDDALDAIALLKELIADFPFAGQGSISVALSAFITPVVRAALAAAPMHVTTAPQMGSGKSYLFDIAAAIALGQLCPVIAAGKSEDEMEKRLGAALMGGQPIISIDNVNGELGGEMLCQAVERPVIKPRILGKSDMGEVQNRATFFATGNNITLLDDMTRRVIICALDAGEEKPELRRFRTKPAQVVLDDRGPYIAACLNVVRAYHLAGKPNRLPPLASFEDWSDMVRSALVWLGEDDPIITMERARENDPMRVAFAAFIHAWSTEVGTGRSYEMTAAELVKAAEEGQQGVWRHPLLRDAVHEIIPEKRLNSKSLGKWLARHENKLSGGLKLVKVPDEVHGHRWYLLDPSRLLV